MCMRVPTLLAAVLVIAAACGDSNRSSASMNAGNQASGDSLCGVLWSLGADSNARTDIELETGIRVRLEGELAVQLAPLAGATACVWTEPSTTRVRTVQRFAVRRVAGEPAEDGVFFQRDSAWFLHTVDAREVPLRDVPGPMLADSGRRMWVILGDSGRVKAAGVIK